MSALRFKQQECRTIMDSVTTKQAPSLVSLCVDATTAEILRGNEVPTDVYDLPADLFDELVRRSPPLALQKLQNEMPEWKLNEHEIFEQSTENGRKRKRDEIFNQEWNALFKMRWPELANLLKPHDWNDVYWATHLQNCLDEAVELALLPSFDGRVSDIQISDTVLKHIGCGWLVGSSPSNYSRLYQHCEQFAHYIRYLKLQNVLCTEETCHLLRNCRLESMTLRWIRSTEHVDALCKLLVQNRETLMSIEFIHCKLSSSFVETIFSSLYPKVMHSHGIQHLSVRMSSFLDSNQSGFPSCLSSFLSSGRSLWSLGFSDNRLNWNFARSLFYVLLDSSSNVSSLDLSENNIAGWMSNLSTDNVERPFPSLGAGKSLQSLHVLNLRGNNLSKEDAANLRYALVHMPNLETLDMCDNPIGDDGIRSLIPCFVESDKISSNWVNLKFENCEISCAGATELLETLSTLKTPLKSLSIAENYLGCQVAVALGKFMESSVEELNIAATGLGSSGFQELQKTISSDIKLVKLDISKNRGGIETAKFFSRLVERGKELVAVNASFNFMPADSLPIIEAALNAAKGNEMVKLEHVDLRGNNWDTLSPAGFKFIDLQRNGRPVVLVSSLPTPTYPYDDDP